MTRILSGEYVILSVALAGGVAPTVDANLFRGFRGSPICVGRIQATMQTSDTKNRNHQTALVYWHPMGVAATVAPWSMQSIPDMVRTCIIFPRRLKTKT